MAQKAPEIRIGTSGYQYDHWRGPDWFCEPVYTVLKQHGAALCLHDMLTDHPRILTADWTYLRFHGDHYQGSYTEKQLADIAQDLQQWRKNGIDLYAYFNNDQNAYAAANAQRLRELAG